MPGDDLGLCKEAIGAMPIYKMHLSGAHSFVDDEGKVYSSPREACNDAIRFLGEIMRALMRDLDAGDTVSIAVHDESEARLLEIKSTVVWNDVRSGL